MPLLGAVSLQTAWGAVAEGRDVYLFLVGMMVLAELARREGTSGHDEKAARTPAANGLPLSFRPE